MFIYLFIYLFGASQVVLVVKTLPANAGDKRDAGLIPGLGRSLGEGNGNPPQNSCLKNPMDRGDRQAAVHGMAEADTTECLSTTAAFLPSSSASRLHELGQVASRLRDSIVSLLSWE